VCAQLRLIGQRIEQLALQFLILILTHRKALIVNTKNKAYATRHKVERHNRRVKDLGLVAVPFYIHPDDKKHVGELIDSINELRGFRNTVFNETIFDEWIRSRETKAPFEHRYTHPLPFFSAPSRTDGLDVMRACIDSALKSVFGFDPSATAQGTSKRLSGHSSGADTASESVAPPSSAD
jgi:hypothetical protein